VNVDATQPDAWKQRPFYGQFKEWSKKAETGQGYVLVTAGRRTYIVFPEEDLEVLGIDPGVDVKVGYRKIGAARRPLVIVRDKLEAITEFLGGSYH
jgi:hypothetical protein